MAMIGVRIDDDVDNIISENAIKRGMSKSDFIRMLLVRGMETETNSGEVVNEIFEHSLKTNFIVGKDIKISAKILAAVLRILNKIEGVDLKSLDEDAKIILERAEVVL
ncbi:MAG: ribbon-helix-helix protein, CopG family [Rickettsiaceae bacterium]|nr:ribbon-helix-helix protein, CopG family [Rickettsiaceae bacterium]